jgi:hypothetical protein
MSWIYDILGKRKEKKEFLHFKFYKYKLYISMPRCISNRMCRYIWIIIHPVYSLAELLQEAVTHPMGIQNDRRPYTNTMYTYYSSLIFINNNGNTSKQ